MPAAAAGAPLGVASEAIGLLSKNGVTGRPVDGCCAPILAMNLSSCPGRGSTFHCTPSSRPAWRDASTKRTSSITCCGCMTCTELITSGPNWRAIVSA